VCGPSNDRGIDIAFLSAVLLLLLGGELSLLALTVPNYYDIIFCGSGHAKEADEQVAEATRAAGVAVHDIRLIRGSG
jgi:hypothetical protein